MENTDNGHWEYPVTIQPDDWFGFIYRIVELNTGREYIGKKQFWSTQRKIVKGRKNRKKVVKPSNWKKYTSSSKHLNEAIKKNGMENYAFFIESLHTTKGGLYYAEVEKQIVENVLREVLSSGVPKYYNKQIAAVKFIPPRITDDEMKSDVSNYSKSGGKFTKHIMESESSSYGNKLSYSDYYGTRRANSIRRNLKKE